jgi:hypothetical protein
MVKVFPLVERMKIAEAMRNFADPSRPWRWQAVSSRGPRREK